MTTISQWVSLETLIDAGADTPSQVREARNRLVGALSPTIFDGDGCCIMRYAGLRIEGNHLNKDGLQADLDTYIAWMDENPWVGSLGWPRRSQNDEEALQKLWDRWLFAVKRGVALARASGEGSQEFRVPFAKVEILFAILAGRVGPESLK